MSPIDRPSAAKAYWRSLDELADTPEFRSFVEREFPGFAEEMLAPSRRGFLKVMGASMALAGLTACRRWPVETIVPFASRPDGYVPGAFTYYATALDVGGSATGLVVTCYDGRPVKVEGNPNHPASLGATNAQAQAVVLGLYDPDRSRGPLRIEGGRQIGADAEAIDRLLDETALRARASGGTGLRVLSEASSSATLAGMRETMLAEMPSCRWVTYEPFSRDREVEGSRMAFGRPLRTHVALDRARVVVCLEADLLSDHPAAVRHARDFAASRRPDPATMGRLWVVEAGYSLTGGMADRRVAVASRSVPAVAAAIGRALVRAGLPLPPGTEALGAALDRAGETPVGQKTIEAMAADLLGARGDGAIAVGPSQPAEVHALAHVLNAALGNLGRTVRLTEEPDARGSGPSTIAALVEEMRSGSVDTLVVIGGNPVFDAPGDLDFASAYRNVPNRIHLGPYFDETARESAWHVPQAHVLEAWGDARGWDGTYAVVQPLIEPLYGGTSAIELVARLLGDRRSSLEAVKETARRWLGDSGFDAAWHELLYNGHLPGSAWPEVSPSVAPASTWADGLADRASRGDGAALEVVFRRSPAIHDGRFANNAWLQEMPDPLTKLTWDNAATLSVATAGELGVRTGDLLRVRCGEREATVPALILPGQALATIGLTAGYGRRAAGRVGTGIGSDVYPLRASGEPWAAEVTLERTGGTYPLATTQDHFVIDSLGRQERRIRAETLVREGDILEYEEHPEFAKHRVHVPDPKPLWTEHSYDGHKWGMAIDLNSCIGCGACTVACQAENNVPVVGKDEVRNGREMHWLRIDRYFVGDPEDPGVAHQPVACQHCENAPCEQVCPVAATVHDHEGLNVMVYNRCIGTRYCSNNCPYKVRRFNWFNNHKSDSAVEAMVFNPEVSVRSRGVMEKCTYCVQRINTVKIDAKNEGRFLRDGEIVPACAQACPTRAITFGDLNDGESRVRALQEDPRAYGILEEINVKPRTKFLARIRNRGESADHGDRGHHS